MYQRFEFSLEDITLARTVLENTGVINHHSYMEGTRTDFGYLGELMFKRLHPLSEYVNNTEYDFINDGMRVDVKCRMFYKEPEPSDTFTIGRHNHLCDEYHFFGVRKDYKYGYFFGYISTHDFRAISREVKRGESSPSGHIYKADGRIINLSDLRKCDATDEFEATQDINKGEMEG